MNSIKSLKREAKRIKKAEGITHSQALDRVAKANGYHNWSQLMKANP